MKKIIKMHLETFYLHLKKQRVRLVDQYSYIVCAAAFPQRLCLCDPGWSLAPHKVARRTNEKRFY